MNYYVTMLGKKIEHNKDKGRCSKLTLKKSKGHGPLVGNECRVPYIPTKMLHVKKRLRHATACRLSR